MNTSGPAVGPPAQLWLRMLLTNKSLPVKRFHDEQRAGHDECPLGVNRGHVKSLSSSYQNQNNARDQPAWVFRDKSHDSSFQRNVSTRPRNHLPMMKQTPDAIRTTPRMTVI